MQDSTRITSISRDTLSERVYAAIKDRILSGEFRQGERIPETAVAQDLGVSSTPVREALRLLAADGLIRYEGRRGVRVIEPTAAEVRHSYEAREAIECAALRAAVHEFTTDEARELMRLAVRSTECIREALGFLRADREFHEFFIMKSGNGWFLKFYREISQYVVVVRIPRISEWKIDSAGIEHVEIARAVVEGDCERAVSILRSHIRTSCRWAVQESYGAGE